MRSKEHASSRYVCVTEGVIERCQVLYLSGRDMSEALSEMSAVEATVIAVESLEADRLLLAPELVLEGPLDGLSDWSLAVAFEILEFSARGPASRIPKHRLSKLADRAASARERILDSPISSPLLWYQDIYFDVGQEYRRRRDVRALDVVTRELAHDLRFHDGRNALGILRDLAETHVSLGQADRGLGLFAQLLRHAPRDLWTYNVMALRFGRHGLARLGSEVAKRALEVMNTDGDAESLRGQITGFLEELQQKARVEQEAEVAPSVLADFRDALAGSAAPGPARSDAELCSALVPQLLEVKVKTPREMPPPYAGPTGVPVAARPMNPTGGKVGRNQHCPCGSGKKYKKCCEGKDAAAPTPTPTAVGLTSEGGFRFEPGSYGGKGGFAASISCLKQVRPDEWAYHFVLANPDASFQDEQAAVDAATRHLDGAFEQKRNSGSDAAVAGYLKRLGYLSVDGFKVVEVAGEGHGEH